MNTRLRCKVASFFKITLNEAEVQPAQVFGSKKTLVSELKFYDVRVALLVRTYCWNCANDRGILSSPIEVRPGCSVKVPSPLICQNGVSSLIRTPIV